MALITCEHCGGPVSDKATNCPHCGAPLDILQRPAPQHHQPTVKPQEDTTPYTYDEGGGLNRWRWLIVVVVVALIAGVGFLIYNKTANGTASGSDFMSADTVSVEEEPDTIVHVTSEFSEAVRKYDFLGDFSEGFAAVSQNGKWGFINVRGEEVISCQYDEVTPFHEGKASVKMGKEWGYIDANNEMVIPLFKAQFANFFSEGLAYIVGIPTNNTYKYRVIDAQGNTVFSGKTDYDFTYDVDLQYSPVFRDGKIAIGSALYDRTGRKVSEHGGETFQNFVGDCSVFVEEKDGIELYGLKDNSGNIVIPAKYGGFPGGYLGKANVHNGVVVVCLPPDNVNEYLGYDFDRFEGGGFFCDKWYYGYADLNGNDTFSAEFKERSSKAMRQAWKKFKEKDDEENRTSWIQGTWTAQFNGSVLTVKIFGDQGSFYCDGELMDQGTISISGTKIWIGSNTYVDMDQSRQLIKMDNGQYMYRE